MEIHLKIIGAILILIALVHVVFPKYFKWKQELSMVSTINKQIMYVHSFFIAFVVLLMGILCLTSPSELVETWLGKKISLGLGIFWGMRLVAQFFGYSSAVWKGKTFETGVHLVFTMLWIYFSVIFVCVYLL